MSKVWVGEEQEGLYQGMKTLFVGSADVTVEQVLTFAKQENVSQIYFGAGNCTPIDLGCIINCCGKGYMITVEMKYQDYKYTTRIDGINYIVTIDMGSLDIPHFDSKSQLKILGRNNLCIFRSPIETDLKECNGETYKDDKVLL